MIVFAIVPGTKRLSLAPDVGVVTVPVAPSCVPGAGAPVCATAWELEAIDRASASKKPGEAGKGMIREKNHLKPLDADEFDIIAPNTYERPG